MSNAETEAEIMRLHETGLSDWKIAKKLDIHIYNVKKITNPEKYWKSYGYKKKSDKPYARTKPPCKKDECKKFIESYFVKTTDCEYLASNAYKDYEYHILNVLFNCDCVSMKAFNSCMLELGYTKNNKGASITAHQYYNCKKKAK